MHGGSNPLDHSGGLHRRRRSLPGRLALAAAVAVPLVALGGGAALLAPGLVAGQRAAEDGLPAGSAKSLAGAQPSPIASPSPTTARPTPTLTATPVRTTPGPTAGKTRTPPSRQQQVLTIVNRERTANGCGTVKMNSRLTTAAQLHSDDQAAHNTMSHTGSDGSSPWERAERAGYDHAIGENVATGYRTAAAVMDAWMRSPGHRANILNCQAKAIGVGVAAARDGTLYWTQLFGSTA